ncbi:hypothetical protein Ssi02_07080 [Sinosporangium siamense]|uniref:DUF2690 domain-containing protein n=2 Tax=Sinosporangium siamense TaxID=1367973 RepID=A0A919RBK8_9ACTN|nr:hypothetical protein Ssi02_07080 [Sinosporangium siamense]
MAVGVVGTVAAALAVLSPTSAQAAAKPYDGQDPYRSGCAKTAREVRKAGIKSRIHGPVGTVRLMWSTKCKTNWVEVRTAASATGSISVYTKDGRSNTFRFKAGNKGRHWGDMLWANNMCAWGSVHVQWGGGKGGQNASGATGRACR